ncbi:mitochondrial ribonuclease P catalytic subunit-like [Anneissia japonica]|uniref:mitochondrial ribonuclease P catalytic subunit-like n=1 Tax=Anneissia japonica TaxID=1529436 RepID=UPI0014257586|nr:mitochondrial ribonuclease P catalytic subunit-like [Anneissia japonica]XP_033123859.1 mitochondrial ribonuclease P catalytic subunit-like [Anneissia japonica]XP_033123860.1 mitochondrial ribonuclease P catalytic subunit-like [Anneissia japonica]
MGLKVISLHYQILRRYSKTYYKQCILFTRHSQSYLSTNMPNSLPANRSTFSRIYSSEANQHFAKPIIFVHTGTSRCLQYSTSTTENKKAIRKGKVGIGMLYEHMEEPDTYLSYDDWMKIKLIWDDENRLNIKIGKSLFVENAMAIICRKKHWQLANSLYDFAIQCDFKFTQSFMNSYLHICVTAEKRDEVLKIYRWFVENGNLFGAAVLKNIINGLCLTDHWKDSIKLLHSAKGTPQFSNTAFNSLVCAACFHKDYDLVEDLFGEMIAEDIPISDKTIVALLNAYDGITDNIDWSVSCKNMVEKILLLFRNKRTLPSMAVAEALQEWFRRVSFEQWDTKIINIDNKHNCPRCQSPLETLELSDAEFKNLHNEVIAKVIHGTDIFRKTSPKELKAFMKFVDEGAPYDVVVDGLNVALVQFNKTLRPSKLLLIVVKHLVDNCGYKCLVLGRRHMIKHWSKSDMQALTDCADCFFTEDVTEDDPFMLYASLHSGPQAVFVTRDMFRDHKALLDYDTHVAFVKWQRSHQLSFINFKKGRPLFKACRVEDTITQTTGDTWHIPVDDGINQFAYQLPTTWLCAKRNILN